MPSNEAIELLENVLSSVNESERWQYRQADLINKKRNDLDKKIENENKKVEYYGKDPSKLKELERERKNIPFVDKNELMGYRKGTYISGSKSKLNPDRDVDNIENRHRYLNSSDDGSLFNTITNRDNALNRLNDKEKALHDRINKRTKAFDTTAKHEAAMILIEALNTLLNE